MKLWGTLPQSHKSTEDESNWIAVIAVYSWGFPNGAKQIIPKLFEQKWRRRMRKRRMRAFSFCELHSKYRRPIPFVGEVFILCVSLAKWRRINEDFGFHSALCISRRWCSGGFISGKTRRIRMISKSHSPIQTLPFICHSLSKEDKFIVTTNPSTPKPPPLPIYSSSIIATDPSLDS